MQRSRIQGFALASLVLALSMSGHAADVRQFREIMTVKASGAHNRMAGEHYITFGSAIGLPQMSLQPGTYVFRRPAQNILQVLRANDHEPVGMFLTIPAERQSSLDTYQIVMREPLAPGSPRRIDAWFTPGERTGQQLRYRD